MNNQKDNKKKVSLSIISQSFYPDIVATGELLFELADRLVNEHDIVIRVLTAQPSFVNKERQPRKEIVNGIHIRRLTIFSFNKNSFVGKILNSWSFFFRALIHIIISRKSDWLLIPTSPPLLPLIGAILKFFNKQKFIFLMHDFFPEIAAKLGYIKHNGFIYKVWDYLGMLALHNADKIIVLSENMKEGLFTKVKNLDEDKIQIIHNWANEELLKIIPKDQNHFLKKYNLTDKFIVLYSGNMGMIHEFQTIMNTARELKEHKDILFLFIGDGCKKNKIKNFIKEYDLENVMMLPYQKREDLSYSLGMADIHLVSLKEGYRFLAAPSKIYGALASGKPIMFVGNKECYIAKMLEEDKCGFSIEIGDYNSLKNSILMLKNSKEELVKLGQNSRKVFEEKFTLDKISKEYLNFILDTQESVYSESLLQKTEKMLININNNINKLLNKSKESQLNDSLSVLNGDKNE